MKKGIIALIFYMLIFLLLFSFGMYGLMMEESFLESDIYFSNFLIIIFSVIGIVKTFWHIIEY